MKKLLSAVFAVALILGMFDISVMAEPTDSTAEVYVTVADDKGDLALTRKKVTVSDIDGDGALTVNDALYAAHEASFVGGATAGYAYAESDWGLSLTRLWGVENGGSYGYAVNHSLCNSLADPVKDGDSVYAYVYTDLVAWSDTYCYFDTECENVSYGDELSLTLMSVSFDPETYAPVTLPVADARITVNGKSSSYVTDDAGHVTLSLTAGTGEVVISAESDSMTLVPPICVVSVACENTVDVYVTISDGNGETVMAREKVTVSDIDFDGELTVNDALYAAHEASFDGGVAKGYASAQTEWGLSLTRLWGVENGGSYGYYVNNVAAWSLTDPVKDGDLVSAFVYTDLVTWSDTYCYFDKDEITVDGGEEFTVKLVRVGFNADGTTAMIPVEGAQLLLDGEKTGVFTDADGIATFSREMEGKYILSAESADMILVPPVLSLTVKTSVDHLIPFETIITLESITDANTDYPTRESEVVPEAPQTADDSAYYIITAVATVILAAGMVVSAKRRKVNEK